jgi:hypothetical protein
MGVIALAVFPVILYVWTKKLRDDAPADLMQ